MRFPNVPANSRHCVSSASAVGRSPTFCSEKPAFSPGFAIPLGAAIGYGLAWYMTSAFETELYRVPLVLRDATYGKAGLIALTATLICAAIVRRRLDRLDLIAVLKTRE